MSRIQKIVERGKSELKAQNPGHLDNLIKKRAVIPAKLESSPAPISDNKPKSIDVPKESLIANRLVAIDMADPRAAHFQVLRTKILQQMRKRNWNCLGISAPTSGAGKSLVAANLAISIAMEGNQSVLLVDMDLRKPSLHRYFCFDPELGIHDVIDGQASIEEAIVDPGIPGLMVLPGKRGVLDSSERMASPSVQALVDELQGRDRSRVVIFDLPPVLMSDDVLVFQPYVDCFLMVVECGRNNRKEVESSLNAISGHPILGTVLNKSDAHTNEMSG